MKFAVPTSTIVVGIIAVLAIGLFAGFGFIRGPTHGTTEYVNETQVQTFLSTQTVVQTAVSTTTATSVSSSTFTVSNVSTLRVPTTLDFSITKYQNTTKIENQTVFKTVNETTSIEPSGAVILLSNYLITFTVYEHDLALTQASFYPGFNGYLDISYESSEPIHWVLYGNFVNETSSPQSTGVVEFPVMADVRYSIYVYNDDCNFGGCTTPFNVTASFIYEY